MSIKLSKRETTTLRNLANEGWKSEFHEALEGIFEDFCRWADNDCSSLEMVERVHKIHNGAVRDLNKCHTGLAPSVDVACTITVGTIDEFALPTEFRPTICTANDEIRIAPISRRANCQAIR